jgi:hypothetical protein
MQYRTDLLTSRNRIQTNQGKRFRAGKTFVPPRLLTADASAWGLSYGTYFADLTLGRDALKRRGRLASGPVEHLGIGKPTPLPTGEAMESTCALATANCGGP